MEELNYLRQDKKIPGKESFVTYVDFQVKDGTADMWLYDIFSGSTAHGCRFFLLRAVSEAVKSRM